MATPCLICCAANNPKMAAAVVAAGWLSGVRLPDNVYQPIYFADQNWKRPNRQAYMLALARYRPVVATVLDWETESQLPEVLSWAEEAAHHVQEAVYIVPKVSGQVSRVPRQIGGKRVVLAYSVPTSYGGSPLMLWEFAGWPVHLLGGNPHRQMAIARQLPRSCELVSVDGNGIGRAARLGMLWRREPSKRAGHWMRFRDTGDSRTEGMYLEAFRRSLVAVREAWED